MHVFLATMGRSIFQKRFMPSLMINDFAHWIQTLLLLEKNTRGKFAESEEEKGPKGNNDTTLMSLAQIFAEENTVILRKIPNKEVKSGSFIKKDFPRSSKLKHRMAQLGVESSLRLFLTVWH